MAKKYDWFISSLYQKDFTTDDFYNLGIIPDNTEILSPEVYKNRDDVQEAFTNSDGIFDDNAFNNFYNNALSSYNQYANDEYDKKVLENYQWAPNDWMAPAGANMKDMSTMFILGQKNPTKIQSGIEAIGIRSESPYSMRELAQANEARDQYGNKLGYTPNDKAGLFKSLSRPTWVYVQYEEDEFDENGNLIHAKGEYKVDEWGIPYVEELGDREMYGREMVVNSDLFTVEGTKLNKYDFFDSDGLTKSVGGTIAKTIAKTVPYFLPFGIGTAWAAINAAMEFTQVMPTIAKAIGSIGPGEQSFDNLNKWESYMARFDGGVSDASKNKMLTFENVGNFVADISGQLFQQRVVGQIPKLLQKTGLLTDASKNIKLGQGLATAYMAATSSQDVYSTFKEAGANDTVAGLMMIANMVSLYGLLQHDYLKGFFFKGTWLDPKAINKPLAEVAIEVEDKLSDKLTGQAAKDLVNKAAKSLTDKRISLIGRSDFLTASLSEGVEETMEEITVDLLKGFTEGLNAIGVNVSNSELNFGWNAKDIAERYLTSFVGGTLGGAMFEGYNRLEMLRAPEAYRKLDKDAKTKLNYLLAEGRGDEVRKTLKEWHEKGLLGNSNLSASKLRTYLNLEGVDTMIAESAEKGLSQNDIVYKAMTAYVDYIENILADEKLKKPEEILSKMSLQGLASNGDDNLLKAQLLTLTHANSGFFNDLNKLSSDIVSLRADIDALYNEKVGNVADSEKQKAKEDFNKDGQVKELTEQLKALREKRDEILEGKRNHFYVPQGLFLLDRDTHQYFLDMTIDKYSQLLHKRKFKDLSKEEQDEVQKEYDEYQKTEGKQNLFRAYEIYRKLAELNVDTFNQAMVDLQGQQNDTLHDSKTNYEKFRELVAEGLLIEQEHNKLVELSKERELTNEEFEKLSSLKAQVDEKAKEMTEWDASALHNISGSYTDSNIKFNISTDGLETVKQQLFALYDSFASNQQVMRSEDELQAFYNLVKSTGNNALSIQSRFSSFLDELNADNQLFDPSLMYEDINASRDDIEGQVIHQWDGNFTSTEKQLMSILQELEDAIGKDSKLVLSKYNEAKQFILDHVDSNNFNEQQVDTVLFSLLPKVGNQTIVDFLQELDTHRSKVKYSPIYDILRQFQASYSDNKLDIASLLNGEINRFISGNSTADYVINSKQVIDELKETQRLLLAIRGLINGAYSGLNKTANVLLQKEGLPLLVDLDDNTTRILNSDAEFIFKRIALLLEIAANNGKKKLKEHKESEMKLKPLTMETLLDKNFVKQVSNVFSVDLEDLWKKCGGENIDLKKLSDKNWKDFENVRIEFESAVFEAFKDLKDDTLSEKLIKLLGDNLYKMQTTKISSDTNSITSYDLMWYFTDMIVMDAKAFYDRYTSVVKSKSLAPVYGQELAIRRNIAMAVDPTYYNGLLDQIEKNWPEGVTKKRILHNFSVIDGGAGTGKTRAVSAISAEMLNFENGSNVEFVYLAPTEDQVKTLQESVGIKGTILTEDSLKDHFISNPRYVVKDDDITWDNSSNNKSIWGTSKKRKVLIVDEFSLLNSAQLQMLSQKAENEGGLVWALGDSKQNSAVVTLYNEQGGIERAEHHHGMEDFIKVKSPSLTTALRPSTVGKVDNALLMDSILTRINERAADDNINNPEGFDKLTAEELIKLPLKYHEDSNGAIYGEKFIKKDQVASYLEKLSKLGTVAYIGDEDPHIPNVVYRNAKKAQGGEWDFVVIDKKWTLDQKYDVLRDLYTLSQRSVNGTLIVDDDSAIRGALKVEENDTIIASEPMELSDDDMKAFVQWKFDSINANKTQQNFTGLFSNSLVPTSTTGTINQNLPPAGQQQSPPKIDKEEEKRKKEEEEKSSQQLQQINDNPASDSGETQNPDGEKKVETKETSTATVGEINTSPETTGTLIPDPVSTPEVKLSNPNGILVNDQDYMNIMFDSNLTYWKKYLETDSVFKKFGLTAQEARDMAFYLASMIKNGNPVFESTNIRNGSPAWDNVKKFVLQVQKNFNNTPTSERGKTPYRLHFVQRSQHTWLMAEFTDYGTKETFDIPVLVLNNVSGLNGTYYGDIELKKKATFSRNQIGELAGKPIYEHRPVSAVLSNYPWLTWYDKGMVISVDKQSEKENSTEGTVDDYRDYPQTVKYLEDNNGKGMFLFTDNSYLAFIAFNDGIYSKVAQTNLDGTIKKIWTYAYDNAITNAGAVKHLKPSDVIRYSIAYGKYFKWNETSTIGLNIPHLYSYIGNVIGASQIISDKASVQEQDGRRWQILHENNCSRFLAEMYNRAGNGNSEPINKAISSSLHHLFSQEYNKKPDAKGNRWVSSIRVIGKNGKTYLIGYDPSTISYIVSEEGTTVKEQFNGKVTFPITEIYNYIGGFNAVWVKSTSIDTTGKKTRHDKGINRQIASSFSLIGQGGILEDVFAEIDKALENDVYFKYGVFANVAGASGTGAFYPNLVGRRFEGDTTGLMTDAIVWEPSSYEIDRNQIVSDEQNASYTSFETYINGVKELVSNKYGITPDNIYNQAISDFKNGRHALTVLSDLENLLNKELIRNVSNPTNIPLVIFNPDTMEFETDSYYDPDGWLAAKLDIDRNAVKSVFDGTNTSNFGIFSVSLSEYYILEKVNDKWEITKLDKFDSVNEFNSVMEHWKNNQAFFSMFMPDFELYMKHTFKDANPHAKSITQSLSQDETLRNLVNAYLLKRINSGEC